MARTGVVLGASGLVGSECLKCVLEDPSFGSVHALVRRPLSVDHPKQIQHTVSFDALDEAAPYWNAEDVFCCLGTTMAKAGSQEAFRRVDHDYPLAAARCAKKGMARSFVLVSALGSNAGSRVFYNRVKGETERDLRALELNALVILRPSLIVGDRKEPRPGERIAAALLKPLAAVMVGRLKKYRPIHASTIGRAMLVLSLENRRGISVLESDAIERYGRRDRHA
jgi:uncharacterized protein YbjT (DUF2867 family)